MTTPTPSLSEEEIKRLLSIAMAQPSANAQQGRLTLEDLKAGAAELGVPAEKLDDAYRQLRAEQGAQGAAHRTLLVRKQRARRLATAALVGAGLVAVGWYVASLPDEPPPPSRADIPRGPFRGNAHVTVTSRIDDGQPVDSLARVRVTSHRTFTVFVSLSGLEHLHKLRTDLVDTSTGNVVESDTVQLVSKAEPYSCWFKLHVPFNRKPGRYEARTYADDQLIATTPIDVVIGNSSLQTAVNTENANPVNPKTTFVRGADTWVLAYLHFDDVQGSGANVEYTWTAPGGSKARSNTIAVGEAKGSWAMWDVMTVEDKTPLGKWTIDASFEGTHIASTTFELVAAAAAKRK